MTEHDDCGPQPLPSSFLSEREKCLYLPDRLSRHQFFDCGGIGPEAYQFLMEHGFRRSGQLVYRPCCPTCRECVSLRVPVAAFQPSRSQRRVLRRNADIRVAIGTPKCGWRKAQLYSRYLSELHDNVMSGTYDELRRFLYESPTDTLEMRYYLDHQLVGVGIVDHTPQALSSVYFYFDPDHRHRSLGTFSILREIGECRARGLAYWYAGYYIRDCRKMNYKAGFRPHELLSPDGVWLRPPPPGLPRSRS